MLLDLSHHIAGGRCSCTCSILAHDCPSALLITQWLVLLYSIVTSPDKGLFCLRVEPLMLTLCSEQIPRGVVWFNIVRPADATHM
jgi:hypothetical protein